MKFLLYLFLFYVIFRFLFGKFISGSVRTKVFRFETHHHHHNTNQNKAEGSITINPKINQEKNNASDKNIGEYVDFEEIK